MRIETAVAVFVNSVFFSMVGAIGVASAYVLFP